MLRRSVRIFVLLLTVAVTTWVVWRATTNEQARGVARMESQRADLTAADAVFTLAELRATLHAYVAPGQGEAFWAGRAQSLFEGIRSRLTEIGPAAAAANYSLADALGAVERLEASERRLRRHVQAGQMLLAGDIIFTESRDLIDAAAHEVSGARQALGRAASLQEAGMANEQSLLAGALMSVWIFALILLVPTPRPAPKQPPVDVGPAQVADAAPVEPTAPVIEVPIASDLPTPAPLPSPVLQSLAELCLDLGRVSDADALTPLLARSADLMDARGVVVWLLSPDGQSLAPAVSEGYEEQVTSRLGTVSLGDDCITASAFRTQAPATTLAADDHAAALALPILSATGPSGVLAAELRPGGDLDRGSAIGGVIAAQLANLFPAAVPTDAPPQSRAHA